MLLLTKPRRLHMHLPFPSMFVIFLKACHEGARSYHQDISAGAQAGAACGQSQSGSLQELLQVALTCWAQQTFQVCCEPLLLPAVVGAVVIDSFRGLVQRWHCPTASARALHHAGTTNTFCAAIGSTPSFHSIYWLLPLYVLCGTDSHDAVARDSRRGGRAYPAAQLAAVPSARLAAGRPAGVAAAWHGISFALSRLRAGFGAAHRWLGSGPRHLPPLAPPSCCSKHGAVMPILKP